jgi:superfamily I DNA and/or RNA helicase
LTTFSGNEDDFILISLVRSRELGFLKNLRRTNVMLTRCKMGMVIFTSRAFMAKKGKESLVGKMIASIGEDAWVDSDHLDNAEL